MDVRDEITRLRRKAANVRSREIFTLLEATGWSGRKRKHWVYSKAGHFPIIVPDHPGALKVGTVHQILDRIEEDYPNDE